MGMGEDEGTIFFRKTNKPMPEVALEAVLRQDLRLHVLDRPSQVTKDGVHVDPVSKIAVIIRDVRCNRSAVIVVVRNLVDMPTTPGIDEAIQHAPCDP